MNEQNKLFQQIIETLLAAKRVLVIADQRPDGDSVGSSTALYRWLRREGKDVILFYNGDLPKHFRFVDGFYDFKNAPEVFDETYDVIVTVDGGDLEHIGIAELLPRAPKGYTLINIDHHATNNYFGDLNLVETGSCSTCEVVYRLFNHGGVALDDKIATSLLMGVYTDTGHFQNAVTNVSGIEAAGRLCRYGARHNDILKHLVVNKSIPSLKVLGLALERLSYNEETDIVTTYFLKEETEMLAREMEAFEGLSNFISATCSEADTVLVLKEYPEYVKGSLRSMNKDILMFAEALGGGGHKKAAGFRVSGKLDIRDGKPRVIAEGGLDAKTKEGLKSLALYPLDC